MESGIKVEFLKRNDSRTQQCVELEMIQDTDNARTRETYGHEVLKIESESEVGQSCPTLRDPVDCRPPGSSVHGILQARILAWVAISFSRGSSQPRDRTRVSHIAGRHFNL